jgi:hypothetical protein
MSTDGQRASRRGHGTTGWWPPGLRRAASAPPARAPGRPRPGAPAPGPGGHGPGQGHGQGHGPEHGPGHGHGHGPGHGSGATGEILYFAWTIDGTEPTSQEDIFAVDAATGTVRRLTNQSSGVPFVSDRDASWSPDRSRIVFMSSDAIAPTHLPVLTSAGAVVTDLAVEGMTPVWLDADTVICVVARSEPDGTGGRHDLVAVDVSAGTVHALTAVAPGEHLDEPAWHPTAGLAAILSREDPVTGEWLLSELVVAPAPSVSATLAGGPALTAVSFTAVAAGFSWPAGPDWSPDGTRIAFSASRPCATVQPDGTPVLQMDIAMVTPATLPGSGPGPVEWITDDTAGDYDAGLNDGSPAFSPDGAWLAWARGHEDDWTTIVLKRLGAAGAPTVLLGDQHWFRWGLDW